MRIKIYPKSKEMLMSAPTLQPIASQLEHAEISQGRPETVWNAASNGLGAIWAGGNQRPEPSKAFKNIM